MEEGRGAGTPPTAETEQLVLQDLQSNKESVHELVGKVLGNAACVSEILHHVDSVVDLAGSARVCKAWREAAKDDGLWSHLRQRLFGDVSMLERHGSARSWFAIRSRLRSGALSTRAEDGTTVAQLPTVGDGDMVLDSFTNNIILLAHELSIRPSVFTFRAEGRTSAFKPLIRLFNASDLQPAGEIVLQGRLPDSRAVLASNGGGLVCATLMEGIAVCDIKKCVEVGLLKGHTSPVVSLKASGDFLLSSCSKQVCIWRLSTFTLLSTHTIQLNLPFARLEMYEQALSDISSPLHLAAFCAHNLITPSPYSNPASRTALPLPTAHVVETVPGGKVIKKIELCAVLGITFHNQHLLVLSFMTGAKASARSYGGTATVSMYNTATWEVVKLISPQMSGFPTLHSCFQVCYGFITFVHDSGNAAGWQVWGFDLSQSRKARVPSTAEVAGGVMAVADSDRLPLVRLWWGLKKDAYTTTMMRLVVLRNMLVMQTTNGAVYRVLVPDCGSPGVTTARGPTERQDVSYLRHGGWAE